MSDKLVIKNGAIIESSVDGSVALDIQGVNGQLFSITDSLTGDIFGVSDISGIPILGVNSNGTVTIDGNLVLTTGTISATLTNTLTRGSYLTGSNYNGSAATTWAVDATSSNTPSKVVARDSNGYIYGTYYNSSRGDETSAAASYIYDSGDGWMRKKTLANTKTEIVTSAAVIAGLGYTPYNSSNPSSYITSAGVTYTNLNANGSVGTGSNQVAVGNHNHSGVYQPLDADLTAIAALAGTSGLLKKTAADTWTLDTTAYTTNTGTVTSISTAAPLSGGTITTSGTISLAANYGDTQNPYASKTANYFLAAPNGAAGAPVFRAIVAADIPTLNQSTTGNAGTATVLQTARTINGTSFDGSANITTASWGTTRTLTIGSTGKSVDGSTNISWSLAEIGAQAAGSYQPSDADLTAIAALAGTSGLLKKTAANTWTLDTTAYTTNTGTVTSVGMTVPTGLSVAPASITTSGTFAVSLTAGYSIPTTTSQTNWDSAYTQRLQWDGGSTNLVAATGRSSLGLGGAAVLNVGTAAGTVAAGDHNHSGVYAPVGQTMYIGTTAVAINRASAALSLSGVNIDGNAGTVTNGVYTNGSYSDPSWLTISKSKVGLSNVENTALSTWAGSTNITTIGAATATSLNITGNLTVNGTTTTVNSTTVTIDDPILTLGGDTPPTVDDNKDRGIEFKWHNGTTAKIGFFGFDDSTGYFTFIPDATNTSEVFSGTQGIIEAGGFKTISGTTSGFLKANGTVDTTAYTTNTGTVTSISTTAPLSGGVITTTGTISLAANYGDTQNPYASKTANYFLAAPNGAAGAPVFRAIVAADIPTLNQSTTGNAGTATTFSTNRTNYSGVTDGAVTGQLKWANYGNNHTIFDASSGVSPSNTTVNRYTPTNRIVNNEDLQGWGYAPVLMGWNGSQTYGVKVDYASRAFVADSTTGNAGTATVLQTARNINGTSFNGSANITTASWGTTRTLTIGSTGKSVDGSGNVSWSLAEIGAQAAGSYLTTSTSFGGDVSGTYNAIVVADDSHGHSHINTKGQLAAETGRAVIGTGIYTFNTNNNTLGDSTPTTYWSTLAWGNGVGGSAELATEWVSGGQNLWFRSLRDTIDNWWPWKRIYHDNYKPYADRWTNGRTITIGSTGKSVNGSADVSWSLAEIGAQAAGSYQPLDADLTAIAALTGTTGLLKKTAADTWVLDTTAYTTNTGTVTSISTTAPLSGGIITTTGTISLAANYGDTQNPYASKTANYFLAAPNGAAGSPVFRAIVAADIPTLNQSTTGNAGTATVLQTARNINGTSFNGSANITTASWGTARTITIGSTGKSVDGSTNVSWSLAEIGAQAAGSYQPLDADLTAIAALAGTSGLLKKTAANTWELDTNTYLTGNQTITLSGVVTGSGTTSIATVMADNALSIAKTSGLQSALDAKLPLSGGVMTGDLTLSYTYPRINLTDTDSNSDYSIINDNGNFGIWDSTNTQFRMYVSSAGNIILGGTTFANNHTPSRLNVSSGGLWVGDYNNPQNIDLEGVFRLRLLDGIIGGIKENHLDGTNGGLTLQYTVAGTLTDGLTLNYQGDVGIGITTPGNLLHIYQAGTGFLTPIRIQNPGDPGTGATRLTVGNSVAEFFLQAYGSTAPGNLASAASIFANSGSRLIMGVGASKPVQLFSNNNYAAPQLTLAGNGNFVGINHVSPSYALQVGTDSAAKPSTNTWTISSDIRLKENIVEADLDRCYEIVKTVPLKRYTWKDSVYTNEQVSDRSKLGWIANDVQPVFPKAVNLHDQVLVTTHIEKDENGNDIEVNDILKDCLDLNADQMYAAMYGAIQKLQQKVEELEARLNAV